MVNFMYRIYVLPFGVINDDDDDDDDRPSIQIATLVCPKF